MLSERRGSNAATKRAACFGMARTVRLSRTLHLSIIVERWRGNTMVAMMSQRSHAEAQRREAELVEELRMWANQLAEQSASSWGRSCLLASFRVWASAVMQLRRERETSITMKAIDSPQLSL